MFSDISECSAERSHFLVPTEADTAGAFLLVRLFGYIAAITGWDETCEAGEEWIQAMQVDRLPRCVTRVNDLVVCVVDGLFLHVQRPPSAILSRDDR